MDEGIQTEKKRGRPPKADKVQRERRRRKPVDTLGKRLAVNPAILDFNNFVYRWINDDEARLHVMTKDDDWDFITHDGDVLPEDTTDLGNAYAKVVGSKPDGSAKRAYLCRKPKAWHEQDQKQKQTELDLQLERIAKGQTRSGDAQADYIPNEGIKVA